MNRFKTGDIIIIALSLVIITLLFFLSADSEKASYVRIDSPSNVYYYPLTQDSVYKIKGNIGESIIEVKNGEVRFLSSPCKNKICIKSGKISKTSGVLACLPNGITVSITGESEVDDVSI